MSRRWSTSYVETVRNREEMIQYFYKCMLTYIVDTWDDDLKNPTDYMIQSKRICIYPNKEYHQVCNRSELDNHLLPVHSLNLEDIVPKSLSKYRGTRIQRKSKFGLKHRHRKSHSHSKMSTTLFEDYPPPDVEDCVLIHFSNGNTYNGPLFKKKFHGNGTFKWHDGSLYIGDFLNGEITGKGKFYYSDQSSYEGSVYKGYPHGYGKKNFPESPLSYAGEWWLGKKHGPGWVVFSEDNWYDGEWKTDKMHGKGMRCYQSGAKYQGYFCEGVRQGQGCAILWNSDFYLGEWLDGKRSGYGEYVWRPILTQLFSLPVQNKFVGYWLEDRMHGKGELHFGSKFGARYIGHFQKNFKHGGGTCVCDNGDIIKHEYMFANDKPVRFQKDGKVEKPIHETQTCMEHCQREYKRLEEEAATETKPLLPMQIIDRENCQCRLAKKIFLLSNDYDKENLAHTNLCQFAIDGDEQSRRTSLRLRVKASPEILNLDPFIRKLCGMVQDFEDSIEPSESFTEAPNTWQVLGIQVISKKYYHYDYQQIYNIEEKALRRAISINLGRLKEIYKQYSLIGCLKKLPYETLMNRLFLWQMYRDCKISEKGISITCIDTLLDEDTYSLNENKSIYDPFEPIYFWQFLTSLLRASWEIYGQKTFKYVFEGRSILEQIFSKFLQEDIFPNVGHHIGNALFDYKDIIPIKAAYNWYKSIAEPMTVQTFVFNIFALNKRALFYESVPKNYFVQNGINVTIGSNVVFLVEDEPKYPIGPRKDKVIPFARKCDKKKLYFLHELGTKLIYKKIRAVVPGIFINKECFNHDYKLCFLEFYEIILICTQHILRRKELKFKKNQAKISAINENVLLKIMTTKKTKASRKSASSHHSIAKRSTTNTT